MPTVRLLLDAGCSLSLRSKIGHLPLHSAVIGDRTDVAELLLEADKVQNAGKPADAACGANARTWPGRLPW